MTTTDLPVSDRMRCMEVWGGNSPVDRHFVTTGLEFWIRSRPFQDAPGGGDVYYVSSCASGRITRLLLADVSGHGDHAAAVANNLRDLMRRNINLISQNRFVREMNRQFSEQPEEAGFATAAVCTFFAPTRALQLSNAGHPAPLLYKAITGAWSSAHEIADSNTVDGVSDLPLGVVDESNYSSFDIKLEESDMLLCVSDAFIEALDEQGKPLGYAGLRNTVAQLNLLEPQSLIPELENTIRRQHPDNLSQDDATIILLQVTGASPTMSDNLMAPFRYFGRVRDNTTLEPSTPSD